MSNNGNCVLYVFIDESGNLDFGPKGTKNFVLAAVITKRPLVSSLNMQKLKYGYLEKNINIEYFHASEDRQFIRDSVISEIDKIHGAIDVNFIHTRKTLTDAKTNPTSFYANLGIILSSEIITSRIGTFDKIIIIFDKCLRNKDQKAFLKTIKPKLNKLGMPYGIYFHRTLSDFNGQIADYFAWAKYVSLERNERRPLIALKNIKQIEFDLKNDHPAYL